MPVMLFVQIVIRLFAVYWFATGLIYLASSYTIFEAWDDSFIAGVLTPVMILIVSGALAWFLAPWLGKRIARPQETAVLSLGGLNLTDVYSTLFVFLGLYFVLLTIPDLLLSLYQWFRTEAGNLAAELLQQKSDIGHPLLQIIAGVLCLLFGRSWARKLAARHGAN